MERRENDQITRGGGINGGCCCSCACAKVGGVTVNVVAAMADSLQASSRAIRANSAEVFIWEA